MVAKKSISVSDGTKLSYLDSGSGKTLVLIPGWSQTAEQFRYQFEGLSGRYRVIGFDMRGHGDSEKPRFGYRIQRLAKDVYDALQGLDLKEVTILGHSMGCSVLWCYFDLFGTERISKFIFCDEPPFLTSNPAWSAEELENAGASFSPDAVTDAVNALAGPDGVAITEDLLRRMVTQAMPAETLQWIIDCNLKMPRKLSADLVYNHSHQDWRDVFSRINIPSLFIGGRVSCIPQKGVAWAAGQVKGSRLEIFEESEGGQHFMFIENPSKFNSILTEFIG